MTIDWVLYDEHKRRYGMKRQKRTKRVKKAVVRVKKLSLRGARKRVTVLEEQLKQALKELTQKDVAIENMRENYKTLYDLHHKPFIWTTHDGRQLRLSQMDDRHLQNLICYLQRRLVRSFGITTWLESLRPDVHALYEALKDAQRRELRV